MGVRDIMRSEIVSVSPDADIEDIGNTMFSRGVGSVIVAEDGELRGIVTDRDLAVELLAENRDRNVFEGEIAPTDVPARSVMTTDPLTVSPDDELPAVLERMRDAIARRIPVVEDGDVVGIVALDDVIVHIAGESERVSAELRSITDVIEREGPTDHEG
ncbi:CBS domain-containing protein [Haladaptatus sp. DYF46]|uniref:CBS domain-containing protein n=1 Tax=Haladaptatus sp. DYF46 TaxID=2886041 RepID=UPI001E43E502|nr:CBS domain-containing protein [Haladaptatus sp. DYF46]